MLLAYCFIAIFSAVVSKPKKDFISRLAVCSKHVQSSFSGWTYERGQQLKHTKLKKGITIFKRIIQNNKGI